MIAYITIKDVYAWGTDVCRALVLIREWCGASLWCPACFLKPVTPTLISQSCPSSFLNNKSALGLSKRTTTEGLRDAFAKFGEVVHAKVVTDRVSGYSKGFGFVNYATLEDAAAGIKGMDGQFLDGWVIFAEYARPRPPFPSMNNGTYQGRQ